MPKSMTGYGRGESQGYDRRFKVEIKSVNHRYSDFTIKLPRSLNPFEDAIRKRLAVDITRGKVDVWVSFESFTARDVSVRINEPFADAYVVALKDLASRYGWDVPPELGLELLARNPDIMPFEKLEITDKKDTIGKELSEVLFAALEEAVIQFNQMRLSEGIALSSDISGKLQNISQITEALAEEAPNVAREHGIKLRARLTDALSEADRSMIDESRLATEVALIVDKAGIDEEIARLKSHIRQLGDILEEPNPIGRKLDFLVQEMNREANTIGSKSADALLSKLVVELKSEIEKIREQVQNIE